MTLSNLVENACISCFIEIWFNRQYFEAAGTIKPNVRTSYILAFFSRHVCFHLLQNFVLRHKHLDRPFIKSAKGAYYFADILWTKMWTLFNWIYSKDQSNSLTCNFAVLKWTFRPRLMSMKCTVSAVCAKHQDALNGLSPSPHSGTATSSQISSVRYRQPR